MRPGRYIRRIKEMELLLVFLSTAVGTVVGVVAAVVMMNRRNRTPQVNDAALRTQLQNTEWALSSAGRDVEELRKQLAEREGVREELERTQQQLVALVGDKDRHTAERAIAMQRVTELEAQAGDMQERLDAAEALRQRVAELEGELTAAEQRGSDSVARTGEEGARRIAELETALAASEERAQSRMEELTALRQGLDVASEAAQRVVELEAALGAAEQRAIASAGDVAALRDRIEQLTTQVVVAGSEAEESAKRIASLEAELQALEAQAGAERERYQRAASDATELEVLLRKERQSAVEAMQLLSQVHDKFSGAFAPAH